MCVSRRDEYTPGRIMGEEKGVYRGVTKGRLRLGEGNVPSGQGTNRRDCTKGRGA